MKRLLLGLALLLSATLSHAQMGGGVMASQRLSLASPGPIGGTTPAAITGTTITANTSFGFSGTQYLFLDAANIIAQHNGTNAQALRLYNTFTDASNYERGFLAWSGNTLSLGTGQAGTGTARALQFTTNGGGRWTIDTTGNFTAVTDNANDIGGAAALRPRTGYFGTDVRAPRYIATGGTAPTCTSNCGTSPSVAGNDGGFTVTMGATGVPASGWVTTFNGTWPNAPSCHVQMALSGMVVGKMALTAATTTTTLTVVTNGTAPANGDKYHVNCTGT